MMHGREENIFVQIRISEPGFSEVPNVMSYIRAVRAHESYRSPVS